MAKQYTFYAVRVPRERIGITHDEDTWNYFEAYGRLPRKLTPWKQQLYGYRGGLARAKKLNSENS